MSSITRRISSGGHGAPAMMPVRSVPVSNRSNSGWSSSARNIVGTPCTAVHRSSWIARSTAPASKCADGITTHEPRTKHVRFDTTMPKQW